MYRAVFKLILFICLLRANAFSENKDAPIIKLGTEPNATLIEGKRLFDLNDDLYYAFRGIPYAKPPIGNLRFKDPEQLDFLPEYFDARFDGHDCPSIISTNASEDCLKLNIYTKNFNPIKPLPVLVFLHPGGLYLGSGSSRFINTKYLLTKDIVFVSLNYRLGTLGFLNLGTKEIPGNAGFKDQVFALRWIKKYIEYFGGNKADITLMGYSAGGQSVSFHLVSPMSKGLFHKAIIMSGVVLPQTILPQGDQIGLAIRQSQKLNCSIENNAAPDEILNCLNGFNGTEIAATLRRLFFFGKDNPVYLWRPVIERDYGQERFLTDDYYTLIERGEFQRVPILIGFTEGEFCSSAAEILENEELKRQFYEEFHTYAPYIVMFEGRENSKQLSDAIWAYYMSKAEKNDTVLNRICDMISDALVKFGSHRLGSLAAKFVNVYGYLFAYKSEDSDDSTRVGHMDDLFHIMGHHLDDAKIADLYVNFLFDFIKNGKINSSRLTFPQGHILINETLKEKNGSNFESAAFWENLFP